MLDRSRFAGGSKEKSVDAQDVNPISEIASGAGVPWGLSPFRIMEAEETRLYAVMSAMNYCAAWNYPYTNLELTYDEFNDLLAEKCDGWISAAPLARNSNYIRVWGVDIKVERYPRNSMMRARYLHNINSAEWIQKLLWTVENY